MEYSVIVFVKSPFLGLAYLQQLYFQEIEIIKSKFVQINLNKNLHSKLIFTCCKFSKYVICFLVLTYLYQDMHIPKFINILVQFNFQFDISYSFKRQFQISSSSPMSLNANIKKITFKCQSFSVILGLGQQNDHNPQTGTKIGFRNDSTYIIGFLFLDGSAYVFKMEKIIGNSRIATVYFFVSEYYK